MKNVMDMMVGVVLREVALLRFVVGIAGKFEEEESCECDTM